MITSLSDSDIVTTLHCPAAKNLTANPKTSLRLAFPSHQIEKNSNSALHANRASSSIAAPSVTSNNELDQNQRTSGLDRQDYFDVTARRP